MKKRKTSAAKDDKARSVIRCDRLRLVPNHAKSDAMEALLEAWRDTASLVQRLQWRRFQSGQRFDALSDVATDHRKAGAAVRSTILAQIRDHHGFDPADRPDRPAKQSRKKRRKSDAPAKVLPAMIPGLMDPLAEAKASLGSAQVQMVRRQVVGMLRSFLSNRQNDFRDIVQGSSLDPRTRHMLHAVNYAEAWFDPAREIRIKRDVDEPTARLGDGGFRFYLLAERRVLTGEKGEEDPLHDETTSAGDASNNMSDRDGDPASEAIVVPMSVRRLARSIMRHVLSLHGRPSMSGIGMVVDGRIAELQKSTGASGFRLWLVLTVAKGRRIAVPAVASSRLDARLGVRSNVLSLNRDAETGDWSVGVSTDGGELAAAAREKYLDSTLTDELALDFGLDTLFASDQGDLVGRGFLARLRKLDDTIQGIARHVQRSGRKPRTSARYRRHVERLRGFVRTELNRVLNRLIETRRPGILVLERLRFTSPLLSARLNRIVSNCGRSVLTAKLQSLEEELGVEYREVPCAYSSQTCSNCSYVDRRNRRSRDRFECRWCGTTIHADVNASRVLAKRRSPATQDSDRRDGRRKTLDRLVQGHVERWPAERRKALAGRTRGGGAPPDPRRTNPYFGAWSIKVRSTGVANDAEVAGVAVRAGKALSTPERNITLVDPGAHELSDIAL